jgi:hypothetical protein
MGLEDEPEGSDTGLTASPARRTGMATTGLVGGVRVPSAGATVSGITSPRASPVAGGAANCFVASTGTTAGRAEVSRGRRSLSIKGGSAVPGG